MTEHLTDVVINAHDAAANRKPRPVVEVGGWQKGASSAPAMSTRRRFLFIGAMCLVAALLLTACDWTQFRYGPAHTGFNPTETKISPANVGTLVEAWTTTTGGAFYYSSPAVANGVVYVGSVEGELYAFDAAGATGCSGAPKTCSPLWTATTGGAIYSSSPAVANGVVYVGSDDGKLYAFDAAGVTNCSGTPKTCSPLWTATIGGEVRTSPAVANGVVYVGDGSYGLYAFDAAGDTNCSGTPKTCMPLWAAFTGGYGESPAVANGVVYVGGFNILYAFDAAGVTNCSGVPKTCSPLWTATTIGGFILTSPAVANGVVYVGPEGGASNQLYAFDAAGVTNCSGTPKTCTPLWIDVMGTSALVDGPPAVANGIVYVAAGMLYAFDAAGITKCFGTPRTCSPLWTATMDGAVDSSPSVANGVAYVSTAYGALYAFDAAGATGCSGAPKTCTPLWQAVTGGYVESPAVANGVVYFDSFDGKLKAYHLP
jgi:outer membrane protein assembly factor BamB